MIRIFVNKQDFAGFVFVYKLEYQLVVRKKDLLGFNVELWNLSDSAIRLHKYRSRQTIDFHLHFKYKQQQSLYTVTRRDG